MESYPKLRQHFGKIVRDLRVKKGDSQQVMADTCNFERAYISRIERGLSEPSVTTIFKMTEYFGIAPGELTGMLYNLVRKTKK